MIFTVEAHESFMILTFFRRTNNQLPVFAFARERSTRVRASRMERVSKMLHLFAIVLLKSSLDYFMHNQI